MLPRMAIPRAPPSSELVSEIAAAAPARAGGAAPTTRSVPRVITGAIPSDISNVPAVSPARPVDGTLATKAKPAPASTSPPAIRNAGRIRRVRVGAARDPTMKPDDQGSVHKPAASGV